MREIKFRGQCLKSKEMVYGDLIHGVGSKSGNFYILPNKLNLANVKHCDPLYGVHVYPITVGQFSGLYDKNGNEIWEDDIYEGNVKGDYYKVFKKAGSFCGGKNYETSTPLGWDLNAESVEVFEGLTNWISIIGNRFENPELL